MSTSLHIHRQIVMRTCFNIRTTDVTGFEGLCSHLRFGLVRFMVFDATFNIISIISWRKVLLVEETGVPGDNHRPLASH